MRAFHILSPEYPPKIGGVSDYVGQLANGLALQGDRVDVWAPAPASPDFQGSRARVHALPHGFDRRGRAAITAGLRERPDAVALIQYVPLALGGADVVAWLLRLPARVWLMFHEVAYPFERGQPLKHRAMAALTHAYALSLARRAELILVSAPGCERALGLLGLERKPLFWLPIPSNLPHEGPRRPRDITLREFGLDPERLVVGHFSAFGGRVAELLERELGLLLDRDGGVQVLLSGRGSVEFRSRLVASRPAAAARVRSLGEVTLEAAADSVVAADVLLFPYPDGISSRRTSVMGALALGRPVVTSAGPNTEALWRNTGCVRLASLQPGELSRATHDLLDDGAERARLGARASEVYLARFSIAENVAKLRSLWTPSEGRAESGSR
jgi:glycosyltransferase involved in cell wall biosynthesis